MDGFDIDSLDEVIHGRVRLGVMAVLAASEAADFILLRDRLQASDGNLSIHLRKLEEAGYVRLDKSFIGRKPNTRVVLTKAGRAAFTRYLDAIGALVNGSPVNGSPVNGSSAEPPHGEAAGGAG